MKEKGRLFFKNIRDCVIKGIYFIIPFAVTGGVLVSVSYIVDLIAGSDALHGLGRESTAAILINSIGNLTFSLMLPVLAASIATALSDKGAFAAGLVGGYLAQSGATLMLPFGDTTAVSGFIGAIGAGILAGISHKLIKKLFLKSSDAVKHMANTLIIPLASVLITGIIMLVLNPVVGLINTLISFLLMSISEASPILFGGILGAMMAVDLGGTLSKAAYIFATAAIASGEYTAMASVMSAGMTVPLSVALCASVFKVKFSKKESELAKANYLFGLCFVTEGVIPIAAKEPQRVIPACTIAAAVSGALSAGFGCTLIAPFGGILVIPLVGKPLLFIIATFTGVLVGTATLGIFKKEPKTRFTETAAVIIKTTKEN